MKEKESKRPPSFLLRLYKKMQIATLMFTSIFFVLKKEATLFHPRNYVPGHRISYSNDLVLSSYPMSNFSMNSFGFFFLVISININIGTASP